MLSIAKWTIIHQETSEAVLCYFGTVETMMINSVAGGLVALWILARSNLSTRRRIKVEINNPFDPKTPGQVVGGIPIQPTYGKIKVFFLAPETKKCKRIGKSKDGHIEIYVFKVGDSNQRVDITVPSGEKGAGKVFNRSNWFQPNSGEGYYVIRRRLKTWNGSEYPSSYPGSYKAIGLNNYYYETAQRYNVYQNEDDAIASGEKILADYNQAVDDNNDPGDKPTPPPVAPDDPNNPPEPDPVPVDPGGLNGGGFGGVGSGMGAFSASSPPQSSFGTEEITFTQTEIEYDEDFARFSTFGYQDLMIDERKKRIDVGMISSRSSEERREESPPGEEESPPGEEMPPSYYYEQFRSSEGARAGGFQDYMTENHSDVDTSGYDFEAFP